MYPVWGLFLPSVFFCDIPYDRLHICTCSQNLSKTAESCPRNELFKVTLSLWRQKNQLAKWPTWFLYVGQEVKIMLQCSSHHSLYPATVSFYLEISEAIRRIQCKDKQFFSKTPPSPHKFIADNDDDETLLICTSRMQIYNGYVQTFIVLWLASARSSLICAKSNQCFISKWEVTGLLY